MMFKEDVTAYLLAVIERVPYVKNDLLGIIDSKR